MMSHELAAAWHNAIDAYQTRKLVAISRAVGEIAAQTGLTANQIGQTLHWATVPSIPLEPGEPLPAAVADGIAETILHETPPLPWPGGVQETAVES